MAANCLDWALCVRDRVGNLAHLNAREHHARIRLARVPNLRSTQLKDHMGWKMPWYTITDSFDADSESTSGPGTNAFIRDGAPSVPHTFHHWPRWTRYSVIPGAFMDITALGRQESWEDSPPGYPQGPPYEWWRRHDEYDDTPITPADGVKAQVEKHVTAADSPRQSRDDHER